jgi:hypothetical protein
VCACVYVRYTVFLKEERFIWYRLFFPGLRGCSAHIVILEEAAFIDRMQKNQTH